MARDVFGFHVPRVCRVRGESASADDLIPLAPEAFRTGHGELVTEAGELLEGALTLPYVVSAAGAMVVLGEPGSGKTSVLRDLTAGVPRVQDAWGGDSDACLWVSGADLTEGSYWEEIGCHLEALPRAGEDAATAGVLTVVLDQVDESPLFLPHLPGRLRRSLGTRDTRRVRFLMACRTADYPVAMTSVLSSLFGGCRCVDLAPLSREEAVALADSAGVNGEELVAATERAGAAVLASVPLTLELLVLIHKAGDHLTGTPEELFARGVTHLAEEPDPRRLPQPVTTTTAQRLGIAGRIAAWMLLSGRRAIWQGQTFEAGPFDLPGGALAGGTEHGPGGSYQVTPQMLQETLATALFTRPDESRVAFRHSSVAAYLAARYLTDHGTTQPQLENLFLVGSPAGDTASVPPPLRETAAWLVALNPSATAWLARADPESLAVHSALVRSHEIRRLTVDRLLERAPEVELSDIRWQLSRWDLQHPLLADQLADALQAAPSNQAADWRTRARVRLAVQLAQDAGIAHPRLAEQLLRLVQDDTWHQAERRLAARAAFACDAQRAAPVLNQVLASLSDRSYAESIDPEHDLRGTILFLLWPGHLDVTAMLAALRPPVPRNYNAYSQFLQTMADHTTEAHLPPVLAWVRDAVQAANPNSTRFTFEAHSSETDWANSLIDRALRSEDPEPHLAAVSDIVLAFLRNYRTVRVPECLQPDEQGNESARIRSLRWRLGKALVDKTVESGLEPAQASWLIAHDWEYQRPFRWNAHRQAEVSVRHQLLDASDFEWVRGQTASAASAGSDKLVAVYGELAARLFPRDDQAAFESAYDKDHPAWPYLRDYYDPIELDSPLAEALRRNHHAAAKREQWPQAAEFAERQAQLLKKAKAGDNESLWLFLWNLRADPRTGRFVHLDTEDFRQWPGAAAFGEDLADVTSLALGYVTTENDRADSWLGQGKHDKRSWAGYILLTELRRVERLDALPESAWCSWTGAILTEMPTGSSSFTEPTRRDLLRRAAALAPASLARRMTQLGSAAIANGQQPIELNPLDPRWAPELRTAMEDLATRLSPLLDIVPPSANAPVKEAAAEDEGLNLPDIDEARHAALRTWCSLLDSLLRTGSPTAHGIIDAALDGFPHTDLATQAAVHASRILLAIDAQMYWPRIKGFAAHDVEFGRTLALACTQNETHHAIGRALSETGLVDLYLWLSTLYAPEEDQPVLSQGWVSTAQEVRDWRDRLLRELSQRATIEAIKELRRLADTYPDRLAITAALIAASGLHAAANWSHLPLENLVRVLQDPTRRVIRSSTDLLDIVHETLGEIAEELPSHCELLWDRQPGKKAAKGSSSTTTGRSAPDTWRPKPEAALCAYITHQLNLRLAGHKVSVNREVLIHPTDPYGAGDRTDILVEAQNSPSHDPDTVNPGSFKLVLELKGSWNRDISTAQENQLADRYLPRVHTETGIYLVGWYPIELWDATGDSRKTQAKKTTRDRLLADLQAQAASLSTARTIQLRPVVINIPRPHKE